MKDKLYKKMLEIIKANPGLNGLALKEHGWNPGAHGSLRDAENAGLIHLRNGGWYITEQPLTKESPNA